MARNDRGGNGSSSDSGGGGGGDGGDGVRVSWNEVKKLTFFFQVLKLGLFVHYILLAFLPPVRNQTS